MCAEYLYIQIDPVARWLNSGLFEAGYLREMGGRWREFAQSVSWRVEGFEERATDRSLCRVRACICVCAVSGVHSAVFFPRMKNPVVLVQVLRSSVVRI